MCTVLLRAGSYCSILDPQVRLHIRSTKILKAIESDLYEVKGVDSQDADCNALTLFERLDRREVTGNRALGVVLSYLRRSQILDEFKTGASKNQSLTLLDVFLRCLDRNFKVGVSYKTVRAAFQEENAPAEQKQNVEDIYDRSIARNVALGRQVLEEELADMLCITNGDESNEWFLSRKLDGVRCIVRVDLEQRRKDQLRQASRWHVYDITSFSRTGRSFNTLQNIEKVIRQRLEESSTLGSIIDDAYRNGQELHPSEGKGVARMYIDGEVCMSVQAMHAGARYVSDQEHTVFKEQFQSVAGPIRRKDFQLQDAKFFPFDMLLYSEMTQWRDAEQNRQDLRSRLKRLECLFSHPQEAAQQDRHTLMSLEQTLVTSVQQVRDLQEYANRQGWEGLILRRNTPFEGRRSASIRKLKQSKEAEYVVVDVELTTMRLSIGQKYAQRKALASAIISHNGHRVNVGSGFSTEQRLRYAENPNLLIGKEITVEYFEESRSHNRSDQLTSLRFPRVKAVWETGKRDM